MNIGDVLICKKDYPNTFRLVEHGEVCTIIGISYTTTGDAIFNVRHRQSVNCPSLNMRVIKEHFETIQEHRQRIIEDLL